MMLQKKHIFSILLLTGVSYADMSSYYVGAGLGKGVVDNKQSQEKMDSTSVTLQAGYKYNEYVAVEGRYSFGFNMDYSPGLTGNNSNDYNGDYSSWGIYLKPMYPVYDFNIYGLLGYGGVQLSNLDSGDAYESGFQWGLGTEYNINENFAVFVDYVKVYDDNGFDYRAVSEDVESDIWTLGVSYKF